MILGWWEKVVEEDVSDKSRSEVHGDDEYNGEKLEVFLSCIYL